MSAGVKARQLHLVGKKKAAVKLNIAPNGACDPRLASFVDRLAELLVADLLRKPNDKR